jgi:hypothetical protein
MLRRYADHCPACIIGNAHDVEAPAAVFEKLLDCRAETAAMPRPAKPAAKFRETLDKDRRVQRATKGAADKRRGGLGADANGVIHRRYFADCYASTRIQFLESIGQTSLRDLLPP